MSLENNVKIYQQRGFKNLLLEGNSRPSEIKSSAKDRINIKRDNKSNLVLKSNYNFFPCKRNLDSQRWNQSCTWG